MTQYLVLAQIINHDEFNDYLQGHLPTIKMYGGRIAFRSINNSTIHGNNNYDAVVIQEWNSESEFMAWWNSEEYQEWTNLRDRSAKIEIVRLMSS